MGAHEKKCIYINPINEFFIDVNRLSISYRDDIFFRIYIIKNNAWEEFGRWLNHLNKYKKNKLNVDREKNRMESIYESIKENGYIYDFNKKTRDNSITVININNGYNILNGSCRMASIILCDIKRIKVREISDKIDFCCQRIVNINKKFDIGNSEIMKEIPVHIKMWICDYKQNFFNSEESQ